MPVSKMISSESHSHRQKLHATVIFLFFCFDVSAVIINILSQYSSSRLANQSNRMKRKKTEKYRHSCT